MDEIEDAINDIDINKLVFVGSNKKKFNFNTFRMPLNFLSVIYNGEISLKEAEIPQRNLEKKIEELKFDYRPKNGKEKEEINGVLMQANDLLEYRDRIIDAFKDGTFLSEHLKKSDAANDYVLKDLDDFIQKIKSMSEKINLNLFEEFFESPSPADYVKRLIYIKNPDENKEILAEIKDRISNLKDRIKEISETEKIYKNADETLEIIKKILDYNKNAPKNFQLASKVDKGKSEPKPEESIAKRTILRKRMVAKIEKEEKT